MFYKVDSLAVDKDIALISQVLLARWEIRISIFISRPITIVEIKVLHTYNGCSRKGCDTLRNVLTTTENLGKMI